MPATTAVRTAPVSFARVEIDDAFWLPRIRANREQTIPCNYRHCKETGRIDAFKLQWKAGQPNPPHQFWDSDVAKFIEAASYSLKTHPDADLEAKLDALISDIQKAQQPDGYLNTHFQSVRPEKRWTNLRDDHELYCAGHLFEAGVAHFQATGKRTLLDVCCRYADHIASVFGPQPGQKRGYCGHPEIELALIKLYRVTREKRYLDLCRYFVDERGRKPNYFEVEAHARGDDPAKFPHETIGYMQAQIPLREQSRVEGHAVRATYIYSAMADLAAELDDSVLQSACERLWNHATTRLMYLTGGLGSSRHNEGFTFDYDLPNETAYCETCAAIGFVFWNQRMLHLTGDGRYAAIIERALYNSVISGVSLDGSKFFYENPLASVGAHHRKPWFGCACCPPNIARLLASLGEYIYSEADDVLAVNLYIQSSAAVRVAGQDIKIRQQTNYPWDGSVRISINPPKAASFELKLHMPEWCDTVSVSVNGTTLNVAPVQGFISIRREWKPGDTVEVRLNMPVTRIYAHPRVRMNCGRVALQRGPLVYCIEGVDNGADLNAIALPSADAIDSKLDPALLGGMVTLEAKAQKTSDDGSVLYRQMPPTTVETTIKAIPYFAWDNRAPGEMLVWIREA
jgi:DUF1680 family protein